MKLTENHRKLVKIATLYYQEGYTQAEIGRMMNISRPVISKMLQQAKEQGIVSIYIKDEASERIRLALALQKKFNLIDAIVVPYSIDKTKEQMKKQVAQAAVSYLLERLNHIKSIGISWGTTLFDVVAELPYVSYPHIQVAPLVGGISAEHLYYDTNHLVFRLSEKLNSSCRYFYAPALAESVELATILEKSQMLQEAIQAAKSVDLALVGVGNPQSLSTWDELGYLDFIDECDDWQEICGDAVASLFDHNGKTLNNKMTKRMLGIKVEDLSEMKEVVLIVSGKKKAPSLVPLLKDGQNKTLIIDQQIAEILLKEDE